MSLKAMLWALEECPVDDPTALLVIIAIADRADENGLNAWPAQSAIAERARCSERTVRRKLADLELAGVICRGDQDLVSHFRPDRRPVVWDLPMVTGGQNVLPLSANGGTPGAERGDNCVRQTVHSLLRNETVPSPGDSDEPPQQAKGELQREDTEPLVRELANVLKSRGDKIPRTPHDWRKHARLLIDVDKRDPVEALEVLRWAVNDPFWAPNIKSMKTFRAKYDVVRHKSELDRRRNPVSRAEGWLAL